MTFDFATIYVDNTLAAETNLYNVATRAATGGTALAYPRLNDALQNVAPGGVIYLRQGTIAEKGQADTCFIISKQCTIQPYNGEAVTLTYPVGNPPKVGSDPGYMIKINANVVIDGTKTLTIIGTKDEGDGVGDTDVSILIGDVSATIRRCRFQKWGHAAIKGGVHSPLVIEQNIFEAGGFDGRDHHIYMPYGPSSGRDVCRHNVFTGAAGYTVHLYDRTPANWDIYGNIMYANGLVTNTPANGGGILLGGSGHRVYNNTIVTGQNRAGLTFWKAESTGHVVKNNIIRDNAAYDVVMDASGVFTSAYNNVHTTNGTGWDNTGGMDADPLLTSAAPAAFTDCILRAESTMIGAGELLESPYNQVLDPAKTTWPEPKTITSAVIGGFAP